MTVFDVLAFKMVTALASSTATPVTASDWASVISAMTAQISYGYNRRCLYWYCVHVVGRPQGRSRSHGCISKGQDFGLTAGAGVRSRPFFVGCVYV